MYERIPYYARFFWRWVVQRRPEPLIYGLAITDRCNFNCRGCRVANTGRPDMSWEQIQEAMQMAYDRGFRELYFSGGEPMLWRDHDHTVTELIRAAKRIGFFHVHLYTNGSLGIDTTADLVWVSIDGLPDVFATRRGDHFKQVEQAIRASRQRRIGVIYVIDRRTSPGIEPFLHWVRESRLPVLGVMFYFHTPYYGYDDLFLTHEEQAPIIERLLTSIRSGYPILNSRAGLLALKRGDWPRRLPLAFVADVDGEFACCRAPDAACADCGYAACTELTEFMRLRPSAMLGMMRYW